MNLSSRSGGAARLELDGSRVQAAGSPGTGTRRRHRGWGAGLAAGLCVVTLTYRPRNLASEIRKRGALPLEECLEIGLALTDALDYLHTQLLVHRDIKPSNVIFVHALPKFADVGLVTEFRNRDRSVSLLGTEGYMAPEGPGTAAADLYSLGKLLYEISTGQDRFSFPEPGVAGAHPAGDSFAQRFQRIILRACAANPADRYPSAAALHADLSELHQSLTPETGSPPGTE